MVSITFLICFVFFPEVTLPKKISTPNLDSLRPKKLDECNCCKILSESFNHWLSKTSRGKYEGGDAAWEEAKLTSYSRSEVRLVEIQEGLCSELMEHRDQCYTLAEETEQVLEKWWFNEDPSSTHLYTWLCIETLQYCCPAHHYGDACYPCPLSEDNRVCSGHGRCNGEGTRKGNGTCICKRGYVGNNCEECAKNFFVRSNSCEPCHKSCDGCSGEGRYACTACSKGWQLESRECVDIDECLSLSSCKERQYCVNLEGSYICKSCDKSCITCAGQGPANCTSCGVGFELWSGVCLDEKQREDIINNTLNRLLLYVVLLITTLFLFRRKSIAAFLLVAMCMLYIEKTSSMNFLFVLQHLINS